MKKMVKEIYLLCFKHYSTNTDFYYYYNVCFSRFLIDLKCKTYKRRGIVSLDDIILKKILIYCFWFVLLFNVFNSMFIT